MLKEAAHFKIFAWFVIAGLALFPNMGNADQAANYKKNDVGLYRDVFDQNIYYEGTNFLHLERLYRAIFRKKSRSANINIFDEVPDSNFFTNRHARTRLNARELEEGFRQGAPPSSNGKLTVTKGKFEGLHPGFYVRDDKGDEYLLKFDPLDYFELATGAETVANRFLYAIGYNVPQYDVFYFNADRLVPAPEATTVDDTGFCKKLDQAKLEEYLLYLPQGDDGKYRAAASNLLKGENLGGFSFAGRRKDDREDIYDHQDRREIRALRVFSSWINNNDVREGNTLDVLVEENGRSFIKHYLIDFNASLGAGSDGAKPPMFTHEYMIDYGEATKAFLGLGLWQKPWQKRWQEAGETFSQSPAVGYFDNRYFDPSKYKTQLPYFAFKDLTRADGFWAARIIMSFTDDDIRAMVKAGEYSEPEDADYIAQTLIERRDIIGRYWFSESNPLDKFSMTGDALTFNNLAVDYGFESKEGITYHVKIIEKIKKRGKELETIQISQPSVDLGKWLSEAGSLDILIKTEWAQQGELSPMVLVEIRQGKVAGIIHED
ncbi:MAG: hypothetical protein JW893_09710 [Candidatus Omnitrophica bacterium]|nr:hypothetical protein [Candidatus Omnitrophota bacterium]